MMLIWIPSARVVVARAGVVGGSLGGEGHEPFLADGDEAAEDLLESLPMYRKATLGVEEVRIGVAHQPRSVLEEGAPDDGRVREATAHILEDVRPVLILVIEHHEDRDDVLLVSF